MFDQEKHCRRPTNELSVLFCNKRRVYAVFNFNLFFSLLILLIVNALSPKSGMQLVLLIGKIFLID